MSSGAAPIDPARFAAALQDLSLDALYGKGAELQNNLRHLRSSNEQMKPYAEQGDVDCREAMFENLGVIRRLNERMQLVQVECANRGLPWVETDDLAAQRRTEEQRLAGENVLGGAESSASAYVDGTGGGLPSGNAGGDATPVAATATGSGLPNAHATGGGLPALNAHVNGGITNGHRNGDGQFMDLAGGGLLTDVQVLRAAQMEASESEETGSELTESEEAISEQADGEQAGVHL